MTPREERLRVTPRGFAAIVALLGRDRLVDLGIVVP